MAENLLKLPDFPDRYPTLKKIGPGSFSQEKRDPNPVPYLKKFILHPSLTNKHHC